MPDHFGFGPRAGPIGGRHPNFVKRRRGQFVLVRQGQLVVSFRCRDGVPLDGSSALARPGKSDEGKANYAKWMGRRAVSSSDYKPPPSPPRNQLK